MKSCRDSRNSEFQTDADIGSVCMDPLQRNGSGWFRRTDTAEEVVPGSSESSLNRVCVSKGPRALCLTAIGADIE